MGVRICHQTLFFSPSSTPSYKFIGILSCGGAEEQRVFILMRRLQGKGKKPTIKGLHLGWSWWDIRRMGFWGQLKSFSPSAAVGHI